MSTFKVGDRVVVVNTSRSDAAKANGKHGVILVERGCGDYGVKFDEKMGGHNLNGKIDDGYGWYVHDFDLKLEEVKAMKFNVGDRVMIRYWDDMEAEFGLHSDGCIAINDHFRPEMKHLSGRQATIASVSGNEITLSDWSDTSGRISFPFCVSMVCLVKKVAPKKKLTVAEIEKLVGFGVEVVKG